MFGNESSERALALVCVVVPICLPFVICVCFLCKSGWDRRVARRAAAKLGAADHDHHHNGQEEDNDDDLERLRAARPENEDSRKAANRGSRAWLLRARAAEAKRCGNAGRFSVDPAKRDAVAAEEAGAGGEAGRRRRWAALAWWAVEHDPPASDSAGASGGFDSASIAAHTDGEQSDVPRGGRRDHVDRVIASLQPAAATCDVTASSCPICLDPLSTSSAIVSGVNCTHAAHAACLTAWLIKTSDHTCPVCRSPLTH